MKCIFILNSLLFNYGSFSDIACFIFSDHVGPIVKTIVTVIVKQAILLRRHLVKLCEASVYHVHNVSPNITHWV